MQPTVIEGTWEEIERRKAELIGHQLRVMILPEATTRQQPNSKNNAALTETKKKKLKGFGMLAGILSTEDYLKEKQEEIKLEERHSK